jgi:hypothetical protein
MGKLSYHRYRCPSIVIQQAIWLYFRFALSYRDVDTTLGEQVLDLSVRQIPGPIQAMVLFWSETACATSHLCSWHPHA